MEMVVKPWLISCCGNVLEAVPFCLKLSSWFHTPKASGVRPVNKLWREGPHEAKFETAFSNIIPVAAKFRRFGIGSWLPTTEIGDEKNVSYRKSSEITNRRDGRRPDAVSRAPV